MNVIRHKMGCVLELLLNGKYRVYYPTEYLLAQIDFKTYSQALSFYLRKVSERQQLQLNLD